MAKLPIKVKNRPVPTAKRMKVAAKKAAPKGKDNTSDLTTDADGEPPALSLDEENTLNAAQDFSKLIQQIESEYTLSWWFMKPKWDEWALRLKLYNNQKRDKDAIGDPLLFTIHQTVLASLYSDRLAATFLPRESGAEETAENLNDLSTFDFDEMQKDVIDYVWDWDTLFFGRGLVMLMEFDSDKNCPVPENWDPMVTLRDPRAKSVNGDMRGRGKARYLGREIRLSKQDMRDAGVYFNFENLKPDSRDLNSLIDRNEQIRQEAQGYANITRYMDLKGDNADYRLMEWFTRWNNKLVLVTLGDNRKRVIRYTELKGDLIPIVDRALYPMAGDWDGVSIPDIVEDKQRARAVIQNLGLKVAKLSLHPMYLFDTTRIKNRADLNAEVNKFVGVDGNPTGAVQIMPRDQVKAEVNWILQTLDNAAQRATATPDIQQGQQAKGSQTATEIDLANSKVDTRYGLSAKVFGWSERRFWQQYYQLYKAHFVDGISEKTIRLSGALGPKFRTLMRENIIAAVDPDVTIESKVVSEAQRYNDLQIFRGLVQMIAQDPNTNLRFALKHMAKLSGLKTDMINQIMPPVVDELIATDENALLEKNQLVHVQLTDDNVIHMQIHNNAADTPAKYAHIEAHKKAMILKKTHPELFPAAPSAANPTVQPTAPNGANGAPTAPVAPAGGSNIPKTPLPPMEKSSGRTLPNQQQK